MQLCHSHYGNLYRRIYAIYRKIKLIVWVHICFLYSTLYRLTTHTPFSTPMQLLLSQSSVQLVLSSMVGMMILYAIFSYVTHRQAIYLYYARYMSAMILYIHVRSVAGQEKYLQGWETGLESVAFLCYIQFAVSLMQIRQNDAWSYRLLQTMAWVLGISGLLSLSLHLAQFHLELIRWIHLLSRIYLVICTALILPRLTRIQHASLPYFIAGTGLFISFSTISLLYVVIPGLFSLSIDNAFSHPLTYMQLGVMVEVLCYTMGISVQHRQTEQEKIQYQSHLIEQLQENERKQAKLNRLRDEIARDLHDEMGSQLSSISILSQTTNRYVSDDRARTRLTTIGETARQVMDSMREIVWSLNSSSDTIQHVGLRIRETAYMLFNDSPIQLHMDLTGDTSLHELTQKQRRELHLITKECLTNSLRHSHAQNVWLTLLANSGGLLFTIRDDGKGFTSMDETSGLGLRSMRQRAAQMGAVFSIESEPGAGTTIQLQCMSVVEIDKATISQQEASPLITA